MARSGAAAPGLAFWPRSPGALELREIARDPAGRAQRRGRAGRGLDREGFLRSVGSRVLNREDRVLNREDRVLNREDRVAAPRAG